MKLANWLHDSLWRTPRTRRPRAPGIPSACSVERLEARVLLSAGTNRELFFSINYGFSGSLPDVGTVGGADIVRFDGETFSIAFDGDDLNLGGADLDAFAFKSDTEILMSFAAAVDIQGVGTVNPWDVVLFTASSLGEETTGTFSLFFSGASHGLGSAAGNVDAVEWLDDGSLLISTVADVTVTSSSTGLPITAQDEDVLRYTFPPSGTSGPGDWSLYFDGTDAELEWSTEDTDAFAVTNDGHIFLSTWGSFFAKGVGGDNEDVLEFVPSSLGETTSGSFLSPLFFNGDIHGLAGANVDAIEIGRSLTMNQPPLADPQQVTTDEDVSVSLTLTGDDGDPDKDQILQFVILTGPQHGHIASFNPETGEVVYVPGAHSNGLDRFTFAVVEVNADGTFGLASEAATVSISVAAVNDAPSNTVPLLQQVGDEDQPLVVQGIQVSDVDAHEGDGRVEVALSVQFGTLSVDSALLTTGSVLGNGTGSVILTGRLEEVNAVLAQGVTYLGGRDFHGDDRLVVLTSDLGNAGAGGVLTARSEVSIHIRSPQEQAQNLASSVQDLVDAGALDPGTAEALTQKLAFTNTTSGTGRVGAFTNQVNALVRSGRLTLDEAQPLLDGAEALLISLQSETGKPSKTESGATALDQAFADYDAMAVQMGAAAQTKRR